MTACCLHLPPYVPPIGDRKGPGGQWGYMPQQNRLPRPPRCPIAAHLHRSGGAARGGPILGVSPHAEPVLHTALLHLDAGSAQRACSNAGLHGDDCCTRLEGRRACNPLRPALSPCCAQFIAQHEAAVPNWRSRTIAGLSCSPAQIAGVPTAAGQSRLQCRPACSPAPPCRRRPLPPGSSG